MAPSETSSFKSCRDLWRYLGEMDALVELGELAARDFMSRAKAAPSIEGHVRDTSKQHGICVNLGELKHFDQHRARQNIVVVYRSAEQFLEDFRAEHVDLYGPWQDRPKGADDLKWTIANLERVHPGRCPEVTLVKLFDYYRLVRNWAVHYALAVPPTPREGDTVAWVPRQENDEASRYTPKRVEQLFGPVAAPNPAESLTFDDFLLFSRVVKYLADSLCVAARSSPQVLIEVYQRRGTLKKFRDVLNKPSRYKNAIKGQVKSDFGLDDSTAEEIANALIKAG